MCIPLSSYPTLTNRPGHWAGEIGPKLHLKVWLPPKETVERPRAINPVAPRRPFVLLSPSTLDGHAASIPCMISFFRAVCETFFLSSAPVFMAIELTDLSGKALGESRENAASPQRILDSFHQQTSQRKPPFLLPKSGLPLLPMNTIQTQILSTTDPGENENPLILRPSQEATCLMPDVVNR